jgi:hypothetical protein
VDIWVQHPGPVTFSAGLDPWVALNTVEFIGYGGPACVFGVKMQHIAKPISGIRSEFPQNSEGDTW